MFAAHHALNITVIVDRNKLAIMDKTEKIVALNPLHEKWLAFGWGWLPFRCDGHNADDLRGHLTRRKTFPNFVIAETVKGKGVSFMENDPHWHHGHITDAQMAQIRSELGHP